MSEKLYEKLIKTLPHPASGNKITYDSDIKGFGARITAQGAISFILNYRIRGRERRYTIGSYPDWTVAAAREEAKALKRRVDLGEDPMVIRDDERASPTMKALVDRYFEEQSPSRSARAISDERSMFDKIVLPVLGTTKVVDVRNEDIDRIHKEVSKRRPVRANRVAQVLSKLFNMAKRWEYRSDNPVEGLRKNQEHKRQRYLSMEELQRLMMALDRHPNQQSANAIRLLLLTGARRGEVLGATWDQFDLARGLWIKPSAHTKQRKEHRVPLSAPARQLLSRIKETADTSPFVFPGRTEKQPQIDIKRFWSSVCETAQIENCRIHDLRHTYASILASAGLSLPVIGALLGHTQPNTTARYSHLYDDPLREATERVGSIFSAASQGENATIIDIEQRRG